MSDTEIIPKPHQLVQAACRGGVLANHVAWHGVTSLLNGFLQQFSRLHLLRRDRSRLLCFRFFALQSFTSYLQVTLTRFSLFAQTAKTTSASL
jgi:hypothetical protein